MNELNFFPILPLITIKYTENNGIRYQYSILYVLYIFYSAYFSKCKFYCKQMDIYLHCHPCLLVIVYFRNNIMFSPLLNLIQNHMLINKYWMCMCQFSIIDWSFSINARYCFLYINVFYYTFTYGLAFHDRNFPSIFIKYVHIYCHS